MEKNWADHINAETRRLTALSDQVDQMQKDGNELAAALLDRIEALEAAMGDKTPKPRVRAAGVVGEAVES